MKFVNLVIIEGYSKRFFPALFPYNCSTKRASKKIMKNVDVYSETSLDVLWKNIKTYCEKNNLHIHQTKII